MPAVADQFSAVLPAGRGAVRPGERYDTNHQTEQMLDRIDALCTRAQMAGLDIDISPPTRDGDPTRMELWGEQTIFFDVHPDGRHFEV